MKTSNVIWLILLVIAISAGVYFYVQNQNLQNQLAQQINLFPSASSTQQQSYTSNQGNSQSPSTSGDSQSTGNSKYSSGKSSTSATPVIQSLSSTSGSIGTTVIIYGSGFNTGNITDPGTGQVAGTDSIEMNGYTVAHAFTESYGNGQKLIFVIPSILCDKNWNGGNMCNLPKGEGNVVSGTYTISVTNSNNQSSNPISFIVTN